MMAIEGDDGGESVMIFAWGKKANLIPLHHMAG